MNYMYIDLPTSWKQIGLITSGWVWSAKPWGFPGCWSLFLSETCQLRSKWRAENTETSKWNTTCLILNGRLVVKVLLATKHRLCMVCSVFQIFPRVGGGTVWCFNLTIICISKSNPYISKTTCFCRNVSSFDVGTFWCWLQGSQWKPTQTWYHVLWHIGPPHDGAIS